MAVTSVLCSKSLGSSPRVFPNAAYRGTSLIRKRTPLGPYRRPVPRVLGWSLGGGGCFLVSEVPLYTKFLNGTFQKADPKPQHLSPKPSSPDPQPQTVKSKPESAGVLSNHPFNAECFALPTLQGYLNRPPPYGHHRALAIVFL